MPRTLTSPETVMLQPRCRIDCLWRKAVPRSGLCLGHRMFWRERCDDLSPRHCCNATWSGSFKTATRACMYACMQTHAEPYFRACVSCAPVEWYSRWLQLTALFNNAV
jgi:hypothetical protein